MANTTGAMRILEDIEFIDSVLLETQLYNISKRKILEVVCLLK